MTPHRPIHREGRRPRCNSCGGWLLPDFQVPNHIWKAVVPDHDAAYCLRCFDEMATEQRIAWEIEGISFFPVSGETWRLEGDDLKAETGRSGEKPTPEQAERIFAAMREAGTVEEAIARLSDPPLRTDR